MRVDFGRLAPGERYKLLCAVVTPRPVAWITTIDAGGVVNAASYSFFNVFGEDPPLVAIGLQRRADGRLKDTAENIRRSGEFVVNVATPDLAESMVATAAAYPASRGEPEALGLETAPSAAVAPPRLACAPAALECRRLVSLAFGAEREVLIGEPLALQTRDGLVDPATLRVDWADDYPVARLFGDRYGRVTEIARRAIPDPPPEKETKP